MRYAPTSDGLRTPSYDPMSNSFEIPPPAEPAGPFSASRWAALARGLSIEPDAPVVVALSGGADSVYLLHLIAAADPRPRILAVHVDHRLRGAESERDAQFAGAACERAGVAFACVTAAVEDGPGLEARAREARYSALARIARREDIGVIATGHHGDDALETLLQRLVRGTSIEGLASLEKRLPLTRTDARPARAWPSLRLDDGGPALLVVRPLLCLRREEVRTALAHEGIEWIEDSSNQSARFTRNKIRNTILPRLVELGGLEVIENLRAFGSAVLELEDRCAGLTAGLFWSPPVHAAARRGVHDADRGGTLARASLMRLPRPLQKRALWRLLVEGVGAAPARSTLDAIAADLARGRTAIHGLPRGWSLQLRSDALILEPPPTVASAPARADPHQPSLFEGQTPLGEPRLPVPGRFALEDGRVLEARVLEVGSGARVSRSAFVAELDLDRLEAPLVVRFPRRGDRFHGLGAPGSKPLGRFLADAGVPRASRLHVPLVVANGVIVWIAGLRPAEPARVDARTRRRLVLSLVHPAIQNAPRERSTTRRSASRAPVLPFEPRPPATG